MFWSRAYSRSESNAITMDTPLRSARTPLACSMTTRLLSARWRCSASIALRWAERCCRMPECLRCSADILRAGRRGELMATVSETTTFPGVKQEPASRRGRTPSPRSAPLPADDGQGQVAGVTGAVQDAVDGDGDLAGGFVGDDAAGVGVAVEAREVAARDFEPDPVPGQEDVRGDRQVEVELTGLVGREGFGLGQRVAVPGPQDAVGQEDGAPVGEHVDQLAGEVGV